MRKSSTAIAAGARGAILGALLALARAGDPAAAQEVYKSVDANGRVVYSDRGVTQNAPKTAVHVDEPDPAEVARLAKEQEVLSAADRERARQQAAEDKQKATDEHRKEAACQSARNYYFRVKDQNRIYRRDADGNRVYYSDEEADALKERARQTMSSACGN
jgi:hypothetical protein